MHHLLAARGQHRAASVPDLVIATIAERAQLTDMVIPGYTGPMKTAISLPYETYARASRRAGDLGLSRSEFFARAAQHYLDDLDAQSLTSQIDDALDHGGASDEAAIAATEIGYRLLADTDNEW